MRCYCCDMPGHMMNDCWKFKKNKGKDNNNIDDHNANMT